jgi:type III pantothenate kinase
VLLAVDVGNSNVKVGVFDRGELVGRWRLETDRRRMPDEYAVLIRTLLDHQGIRMEDVTGFSLSSTVPPLSRTFRELSERYFELSPVVSSANVHTGVVIATENPHEIGPDRIVLALGAMRRHRVPAIVLDLGTATTCDAVTAKGELIGCAIAPGLNTAMEGLVARAARLFSVELKAPARAIGRNTVTAVQSGAVYGYVGLVEGLVSRFRAEMEGDPMVIATGGLAPIVVEETAVVNVVDPDLTLHGLRYLYELNAEPEQVAGPFAADTGV